MQVAKVIRRNLLLVGLLIITSLLAVTSVSALVFIDNFHDQTFTENKGKKGTPFEISSYMNFGHRGRGLVVVDFVYSWAIHFPNKVIDGFQD
jgi:hypothetical protein